MTDTTYNLDWLISVDDHVLEPPSVWVDRVAAKDRDRAPHMEFENGLDYWIYDGKRYPSLGLSEARRRQVQGGVQSGTVAVQRNAARVLRLRRPARGHGPRRGLGVAVLPDDHSVLRAAVPGSQRP